MASCDSVLDYNEGDCSIKYLLKFKYDYNMEKVDAFAQEVKKLSHFMLFLTTMEIWYITKLTKKEKCWQNGNYSSEPDFDPGEYHLIAWAGIRRPVVRSACVISTNISNHRIKGKKLCEKKPFLHVRKMKKDKYILLKRNFFFTVARRS